MSVEDRRLLRHVLPGSRSQRRRVAYLSLAASGATLFREPSASSHVAREHPVHNPLATVAGQLWPYQRCRASQIHIKLAMTSPYQVSNDVPPKTATSRYLTCQGPSKRPTASASRLSAVHPPHTTSGRPASCLCTAFLRGRDRLAECSLACRSHVQLWHLQSLSRA